MKVIILAGGLGTRLHEETNSRPKPMVEIGGKPILWHIMKSYSAHGINEFIICCGYKSYVIKEYFINYSMRHSDITINLKNNEIEIHPTDIEPWKITFVETGANTMTGGRLKQVKKYIQDDEAFCFTYGDGVGNINITESIKFHKLHGKLATMTTAYPPGRFGNLKFDGDTVTHFQEKTKGDGAMVNAGYFVLSPKVIDYIEDDATTWEESPLMHLAHTRELKAFKHEDFWRPMDTLPDKNVLEKLWQQNKAPWKVW
jgi:glucose-1-phosphate cytidylyltransferase|tara:strand:- start:588 stop:1358 length:771 start_codon:yes stop_codon:yes gene_type:complete